MQTTRTDLTRSVAIKWTLALACLGVGVFALYLALDMVSIFGEGMGVDARSQRLYANAHIAVHVFGTVSAVLIAVFWASRNRLLLTLAILAVLACGGYGIINMIGFTSTNRVAVAQSKTALNHAAERQYQAALAAKKGDIEWTRRTIVTEESPREKRRLEAALAKKEAELAAIKPPAPTAATVLADPQATLFERLVGWTAENWQLVLPIPVAFLIYAAEALSFIFATHLLFGGLADLRAMRLEPTNRSKTRDGSGGSGGSEPKKFTTVQGGKPAEPSTVRAAEPDKVRSVLSRVASTDAPKGKLTFQQAEELARANPHLSTRALAATARFSQTTAQRVKTKVRAKAESPVWRQGRGEVPNLARV